MKSVFRANLSVLKFRSLNVTLIQFDPSQPVPCNAPSC